MLSFYSKMFPLPLQIMYRDGLGTNTKKCHSVTAGSLVSVFD